MGALMGVHARLWLDLSHTHPEGSVLHVELDISGLLSFDKSLHSFFDLLCSWYWYEVAKCTKMQEIYEKVENELKYVKIYRNTINALKTPKYTKKLQNRKNYLKCSETLKNIPDCMKSTQILQNISAVWCNTPKIQYLTLRKLFQ